MKILLTNCTRNAGLIVLRALARGGHELCAADDRALRFGLHSRYVRRYERLPHESSAEFAGELLNLVRRQRPDVLLPLRGTAAVSRWREHFEHETQVLVPNYDAFEAVEDKERLAECCEAHGIPHPRIISLDQARARLSSGRAGAVVLKPAANLGGGEGINIVADAAALPAAHESARRRYGRVTVSDYIPGPDTNNYALHAVLDREGDPVAAFAFQKLRLSPMKTGITAAAVSRHLPGVGDAVFAMLKSLGWRGPVDVELKLDPRDQQMKLIEINGRFSGAVGFPIACGVDLPEIACLAAVNGEKPIKAGTAYSEGVIYWSPAVYARSVLQELRRHRAPVSLMRRVIQELGGPRVGPPYQLTDPAPTLGKLLLRTARG